MTPHKLQESRSIRPGPARQEIRIGRMLTDIVRRPLLLLAVAYAIAIAFERAIEVDVFKPYRVVGFLLIAAAILLSKIRIDKVTRITAAFLLPGLLLGAMGLSNPAGRHDIFLNTALIWAFNIATYVALISAIRSRQDIVLLCVVHAASILLAARDIAQTAAEAEYVGRVFGDFTNPANATVSMLFSALVIVTLLRRPAIARWLTKPGLAALCVAIVVFFIYVVSLTGSRSGAVLLLAGVLIYVFMTMKQRLLIALLGAVVALALVAPVHKIAQMVHGLSDQSILLKRVETKGADTDRVFLWLAGVDALIDTYGIGTGMGRYAEVHRDYFAEYAHLSDERWLDYDLTLHNDYVVALVEHGVPGLVLFLMLCRHLVRTARAVQHPLARALAVSVLAGMLINGMSHNGFAQFTYWFYFALLTTWYALERQSAPAPVNGTRRGRG